MEEKKQLQKVEKFQVDLKDLTVEAYTKAFMAYRISLENWFLLNELLAYVKNETLSPKQVQERLGKLFGVINSEILREFVRLDKKMKEEEKEETEGEQPE